MGSASISVIVQAAGTAVAVAFWSSVAFVWGTEGHRIVAYIAEQYLELNTSHQVHALLAIENANSLADVAN